MLRLAAKLHNLNVFVIIDHPKCFDGTTFQFGFQRKSKIMCFYILLQHKIKSSISVRFFCVSVCCVIFNRFMTMLYHFASLLFLIPLLHKFASFSKQAIKKQQQIITCHLFGKPLKASTQCWNRRYWLCCLRIETHFYCIHKNSISCADRDALGSKIVFCVILIPFSPFELSSFPFDSRVHTTYNLYYKWWHAVFPLKFVRFCVLTAYMHISRPQNRLKYQHACQFHE